MQKSVEMAGGKIIIADDKLPDKTWVADGPDVIRWLHQTAALDGDWALRLDLTRQDAATWLWTRVYLPGYGTSCEVFSMNDAAAELRHISDELDPPSTDTCLCCGALMPCISVAVVDADQAYEQCSAQFVGQ
ncbi:unnamed protein product, partial [Prorocentrum cordatum]